MLEVQNGGPVVRLVFGESTGRTSGRLCRIENLGIHSEVEPAVDLIEYCEE